MLAMDGSASEKEYYIMQPCEKPEGSVYAPVDAVKTNMRRIMTRAEAEQFIRTAPDIPLLDVHNRKLLEDACKECIRSCDPEELMRVIRTLYTRKQERLRQTALLWLEGHETRLQPRFDVIEIYAPDGMATKQPVIRQLEDAF